VSDTKPRLRFKREPMETGLRAVGQGPRGYDLWYGDERLGSADEITQPFVRWMGTGRFYWHVGTFKELGIEHKNTAREPVETMEEAKAQLRTYVEECLKAKALR
jgi:hypothetical protein